jgi:hypothetical protein
MTFGPRPTVLVPISIAIDLRILNGTSNGNTFITKIILSGNHGLVQSMDMLHSNTCLVGITSSVPFTERGRGALHR